MSIVIALNIFKILEHIWISQAVMEGMSIIPYLPYPDGDGEDPEGPGAQDQRLSVSASG